MITSRINALLKISWSADFKTRKMIANGLVMSRFVYLIQVYGNASEYLLRFLQVLQNKVARIVTRLSWDTGTHVLLIQVGWLSIQQLYVYHSLITVYKMTKGGKPEYLKEKFINDFAYQTRQATGWCLMYTKPRRRRYQESHLFTTLRIGGTLSLKNCKPSR